MAGVRKEDFEEELREEGREVIPAGRGEEELRGRKRGKTQQLPSVALRVPSTLDLRPSTRLPRVELPRGMRISIVLRQKGKVRLHAQRSGDNACLPLQVPFK